MKRSVVCLMIVVVALQWCLPTALASGCRVVVRQQHVQHHAVQHHAVAQVVHKVVEVAHVVPVVAKFVNIPLYGATYNPYAFPAPQAPEHDLAAAIKALAEEVRAMKAQYQPQHHAPHHPQTLPQAPQAQALPQVQGEDRVSAILVARCAACHDGDRAKQMGKGVVLTVGGKVKQLSPEELGAAISAVAAKSMPKGIPMPDAERIELIAGLTAGAK